MRQAQFANTTFGEKLVSVLRHPLFTIPFPKPVQIKYPVKKKLEPRLTAETTRPPKAVKRSRYVSVPVNSPPMPVRRKSTVRKTAAHVFTLARNKEEFEKIIFVLRAIDKIGSMAFTKVLHVEPAETGSRLIATDGKRMHVAEIGTRIKQGDYKPAITKDAIKLGMPVSNINFPNWKRVVPTNVVRLGCINPETAAAGEIKGVSRSIERLSGERVNADYLADLTKNPWVVYRQKEKHKALLLKEYGAKKETYAVIMPLTA